MQTMQTFGGHIFKFGGAYGDAERTMVTRPIFIQEAFEFEWIAVLRVRFETLFY